MFRLLLLALALLLTATPTHLRAASDSTARPAQPNILFIFTDDHAQAAISAYGSTLIQTPHLDRIAHEGMIFRNHFVTNSICGPSRAVILTGKFSHLNGFRDNGQNAFDGSQTTFPKLLRAAGYQTALFGKWHLGSDPTGFDRWEVLIDQGPYYNPRMKSDAGPRQHHGYTTRIITDLTLDFLDKTRDKSKPFLLMYQHKAPHREWVPTPDLVRKWQHVTLPEPPTLFDDYANRAPGAARQEMTLARHMRLKADLKIDYAPPNLDPAQRQALLDAYKPQTDAFKRDNPQGDAFVRWAYQRYMRDYLACIEGVDNEVGRVLQYLDDHGLADNTIVVYSSDQGFYLGEHGWYDKRWMYEQSMRAPLMIRWPGVIKPGSQQTRLTQNLDIAQTFLDMAGVQPPHDMQGLSLVPLLRSDTDPPWRTSLYYHYYEFPAPHRVEPHYGIRTATHKLIHYYRTGDWELFDLTADPDEMTSLYGRPDAAPLTDQLKAQLLQLRQHYRDNEPRPGLDRPD
jgi:arylsulfatase A-like enzyme